MSDKKQTRMMAVFDGVSDEDLRVLVSTGATSTNEARRRAAALARSELERRNRARRSPQQVVTDELLAMRLHETKRVHGVEVRRCGTLTGETKGWQVDRGVMLSLSMAAERVLAVVWRSRRLAVIARLIAMTPGETTTVHGVKVRRSPVASSPSRWVVFSVSRQRRWLHEYATLERAVDLVLDLGTDAQHEQEEVVADSPSTAADVAEPAGDEDNRWSGLSDDDLQRLYEGFEVDPGSTADRELDDAMRREVERRAKERDEPSYRGPGYYRNVESGVTTHVVGEATFGGVRYALVGSSMRDLNLWGWPVQTINLRTAGGKRLYEFLETP